MEKILNRNEVRKEDKWDVDTIYKTLDEWERDYKTCQEKLKKVEEMKDTFLLSKENFKELVLLDDELSRLLDKVYIFASLKSHEDMANATYQELIGKAGMLYQEYQEKTAFFTPMILEENEDKIKEYIHQEDLKSHHYGLMSILKYKRHHLSEEQEKILAAFSKSMEASSDAASYLTDADMRFGNIETEEGKSVELTESNYSIYVRSKDRRVRKDAFQKILNTYGGFKNTLTATLSGVVNSASTYARLTNFDSSLAASLYIDQIPTTLYDNLILTVHKNLPTLYEYFKEKQKLLGVEEFHLYDSYVSTVKNIDKKYPFEEGKKMVLDALSILGDEYIKVLETAFSDNWIDKYPNRGKRTGAYSSGVYDTKPYVLLNYTDTYNDVSTLAHELGHSMHSYFSCKYNDYANHSYPIFLAEIASTVNELLFSYYTEKNTKDKNELAAILNERLDTFKGTVFRQTMFAEFEKYLHEIIDHNGIITADAACKKYYELNKLYFGKDVVVDEEIAYEWLRIPHFYTPFYVYKYAVGLSVASYIAKNILEQKDGFREKYIEFLKSGGRDYPLEILKIIDIDLTDTKVFEDAMEMFKETLDKFKKINE